MRTYEDVMAYQRTTEALSLVAGRLGWDQETMMPRGSAEVRGEEMAAMEEVLHARRSAPELGAALAALEGGELTEVQAAQLRHIRRSYDRATKVPGTLAAQIARVTSTAQGKWAAARAEDDANAFVPVLAEVVALKREEGAALAGDGTAYDALVQDYEPGTTAAEIAAIFGKMRPALTELRDKVLGMPAPQGLSGHFDEGAQMKLARKIAKTFGYDMSRGRVDKAVHPFSSGSGNDVRITTRTAEDDPFNCIYSTIHEVGHACYEQGVSQDYLFTPLGGGVSMGVHESQSRIYENQLGRSPEFCAYLFGQMTETFGDIGVGDAESFARAVNRVSQGFIRTEADELQYNLHVMMRFELEQDLISGALTAADLEEAWNARFEADFGVAVPKASLGCLQDVHWSVGLFGYFPTYALGNVYAGCLYESLRAEIPELDAQLTLGNLGPATTFLGEKVHIHGGLYAPQETIERACGRAPSEGPLLSYLTEKFGKLYGF